MRLINFLFFVSIISSGVSAQTIPAIKSNVDVISIRAGDNYYQDGWTIDPKIAIDPFVHSVLGDRVTFYTDVDSISSLVSETPFDFDILLKGNRKARTRIVYERSKLDVLKDAAIYDNEAAPALPAFTYQSADSRPLRQLRRKYKLDSIAGKGDDVSQMLNLMRWVHNTIEHDGGKPNLGEFNADQFITSCQNGGGTLNCRGLGITLNEVYLAMGFPSRFVTCMPKDTTDFDCHVINTAFSKKLNKWIWLDPTQNAYVMDEKGELLGIDEVRERLINDLPLILNPDANWNYRVTTDKQFYLLEYMAKNLYMFSTPLHSTYDYESREKGKQISYVELWPAEGGRHLPVKSQNISKGGAVYTNYRIRNPSVFWAHPSGVK